MISEQITNLLREEYNKSKSQEELLREEYNKSKSQEEVGKKFNISQQIVGKILSGKQQGVNLQTLDKMFPDAKLDFTGATIQNSGTAFVNGNVENKTNDSGIPPDVLKEIMSNKDLSAKEKAEIIKELSKK